MVQLQTDAALHKELSAAVQAQNNGTFTAQMPHPLGICTGNCPYHPLFQPDHDEFMYGFWGKWNDNLFAEDYARELLKKRDALLLRKRHVRDEVVQRSAVGAVAAELGEPKVDLFGVFFGVVLCVCVGVCAFCV